MNKISITTIIICSINMISIISSSSSSGIIVLAEGNVHPAWVLAGYSGWDHESCTGFTIISTHFRMLLKINDSPIPISSGFFVSSDLLKCRLLK